MHRWGRLRRLLVALGVVTAVLAFDSGVAGAPTTSDCRDIIIQTVTTGGVAAGGLHADLEVVTDAPGVRLIRQVADPGDRPADASALRIDVQAEDRRGRLRHVGRIWVGFATGARDGDGTRSTAAVRTVDSGFVRDGKARPPRDPDDVFGARWEQELLDPAGAVAATYGAGLLIQADHRDGVPVTTRRACSDKHCDWINLAFPSPDPGAGRPAEVIVEVRAGFEASAEAPFSLGPVQLTTTDDRR